MRKTKKKGFWFYNDLYFANVYFIPSFTEEEISDTIYGVLKLRINSEIDLCDGKTIYLENGGSSAIFIYVKSMKNPVDLSVLAHECLHAASMILLRAGVKCSLNNDEAHAYLTGWIYNKCIESLKIGIKNVKRK